MNIILSVESLSPKLTGVGRYTWELARRLPKVLTDSDELRFHHQQRWLSDPDRLLKQPITTVFRSQQLPLAIRNARRFCLRNAWRKQCKDWIFHAPNYFLPPYADRGVITIHDLSVLRHPQWHPAERVRQYEKLLKISLARSQELIAVSNSTRSEIINLLGFPAEHISVTPLAASSEYRPRSASETQSVLEGYGLQHSGYTLSVATLEPRKNIANLIRAYAMLPAETRRHIPLVLIGGSGWKDAEIQTLISAYAPKGWLHYLGYVPQAHLPILYAGARVMAYTSLYEGFGLPVLEAMASGVPVLASNRTSLPEVTQGQALHIDPEDLSAISQGLFRALNDLPWREDVIPAALRVASAYSWDNCVQKTISVYRKLS